jgi:hypothetical protein
MTLANEFGISETGLREMLFTARFAMMKSVITDEDITQVVALHESGSTVKRIVLELK